MGTPQRNRAALVFLAAFLASSTLASETLKSAPDFNSEVRPILSKYCFKCHGPDDKARKGQLRFDIRENVLKPAKSGEIPIVPGHPDSSELVKRIATGNDEEAMPPPSTKATLSAEQKDVLKRWIAAGAEYQPHWAFIAPKQAPLPDVKHTDWPRNAIDRFILARLEAEGLRPSPQAERHTLVRRVYLDLIGLPPTPEEADAFIDDTSPNAYEKVVDKLLASPQYGERWARRWLDLARYADTNGYEKDRQRSIWPYRDWVINALNADMPFDQFTIQQIAGDLLPNATTDNVIATGFHRNTMLNEEGGIDPLEFKYYSMVDRVSTTGKTWLGLTLQCAQCHTHKYDPITHREFYQLMAFLNNVDEPEYKIKPPDYKTQHAATEAKIEKLIADLPNHFPVDPKKDGDKKPKELLDASYSKWLDTEAANTVHWTVLRPVEAKSDLPLLTVMDDFSIYASGDHKKTDVYDLKFKTDLRGVTSIRLEVIPDERLPAGGPGRTYYEGPAGDFSLSEFTASAEGKALTFSGALESFAEKKNVAANAIDGKTDTNWTINGGQGKYHTAIFKLSEPLNANAFSIQMLFERHFCASLGRFRISVTSDPAPAKAHEIPPELEKVLLLAPADRTAQQRAQLFREYLLIAPELAPARKEIERLQHSLTAYTTTLVMAELPPENPRATYIHNRGEYLQPTDKVEPDVLKALNPLPQQDPRNRLAFAQWLVSPENPLTARVTVNRHWASFFGRGIVKTVEDFGYQGNAPSHPALLDWLAVEFIKQGWSQKKLHKLIVMSATYAQTSRVTPELLAKDASNVLLAHAPRVRLDAEQIRDSVLRVSNLLTQKIGGPSVFPPQPANITTEGAYGKLSWKVSEGPDRFRRGLYTFSKRTAPYAMFGTFDAPSGESCLAQRETSNSPLQALTMLNDGVILEASQALGREFSELTGTEEQRIEALVRRCLTRPPAPDEMTLLRKFLDEQKERFKKSTFNSIVKGVDPTALGGKGKGDANERAAWTALARALLNLDEMITKG